jgi:2-oxoglutarate ferredoxin oxidoreductase subunit beta
VVESTGQIHPTDFSIRDNSFPTAWCPGCGIGTIVHGFIRSLERTGLRDRIWVLGGVGCTGRLFEYFRLPTTPVLDGGIIDHAISIKATHTKQKVVVFVNDVDFILSGIDGLVRAGKSKLDILLIYINNYILHLFIRHKALGQRPLGRISGDEAARLSFNFPGFARACGSRYVVRWTPFHVRRLAGSIRDGLQVPGFSVIEVLSPCLMYYISAGQAGRRLDRMGFFRDRFEIRHHAPVEEWDLRREGKVIIGRFVDQGSVPDRAGY